MVRIAQFLAEILIVATVTASRAPVRDVNRATMAVTVNLVFSLFSKFNTIFFKIEITLNNLQSTTRYHFICYAVKLKK